MLTNDELLILGIKTRMRELEINFNAQTSIIELRIYNTVELNKLVKLQDEYIKLEFRLSQLEK